MALDNETILILEKAGRRILPLIVLASLLLASCNLPLTPVGTESALPPTQATGAALGTKENPIVLALHPSATREAEERAQELIAQLSESSGLAFVTITPASYSELLEALDAGRVHVAWLPPFPYLLAREKDYADAPIAATIGGKDRMAAQFLVNARLVGQSGFKVYYNPASGENFAEATEALVQFADKKPCFTDAYSPAGYVLPLGLLAENHVTTKPGAFLQGDAAVVNTLYLDLKGEICEFGVTYTDARSLLVADHPDVQERVVIVWRTEPFVPYDAVAYASSLDEGTRVRLSASLLTTAQTERGRASLLGAFGCDGLKFSDDSAYDELRRYLELSGLELPALVR